MSAVRRSALYGRPELIANLERRDFIVFARKHDLSTTLL